MPPKMGLPAVVAQLAPPKKGSPAARQQLEPIWQQKKQTYLDICAASHGAIVIMLDIIVAVLTQP